jgi:hypothetical protein
MNGELLGIARRSKPREPNLIVSFCKPDKEVIGGATIALLDASEAPWRTGMWKKVTIVVGESFLSSSWPDAGPPS